MFKSEQICIQRDYVYSSGGIRQHYMGSAERNQLFMHECFYIRPYNAVIHHLEIKRSEDFKLKSIEQSSHS